MNEESIKYFKQAGKIAGQARTYGVSLMKEGVKIIDVLDSVEQFIQDKGAGIAFPAQISINKVAAHACSDLNDETILKASDVAKLDVGAHINGFIGDTATTVNLDGKYIDLINASKAALKAASKKMLSGTKTGEIGEVIQKEISDRGFQPVRNLSGHGLGEFQIHTKPAIPNVGLDNSVELKEGMTVASEPFATDGSGMIMEGGEATVFSPTGAPARVRSAIAREIIKKVDSYNGLPFASRWLARDFGVGKTRLGLKELERAGLINAHPPLREVGGGMVAQSEHSFLITSGKPVITTKLDDE